MNYKIMYNDKDHIDLYVLERIYKTDPNKSPHENRKIFIDELKVNVSNDNYPKNIPLMKLYGDYYKYYPYHIHNVRNSEKIIDN